MKISRTSRMIAASALLVGVGVTALSFSTGAGAALGFGARSAHALFVETDSPSGNEILSYHRASDGSIDFVGAYPTHGLGGVAASAAADPLASQDGLLLTANGTRLVSVNAGSNSLSVFAVSGDRLTFLQTVASGGSFPVSLAGTENAVAVLNAGGAGDVTQYSWRFGLLVTQGAQSRSLGLADTTPPFFTSGPGEVAYAPNGQHLVVSDKNSTGDFQVFSVSANGTLGATPVDTPAQNAVPFSFVFDATGQLVAAEASNSSLSTYNVNANGTLSALATATDGQAALCWVAIAGGYVYGSNAGSGDLSSFEVAPNGAVTLVKAVAATTHAGTTDSVTSPDGHFLYVESGGAGTLDTFAIGAGGALTPIETLWNIPVASEGLAIS